MRNCPEVIRRLFSPQDLISASHNLLFNLIAFREAPDVAIGVCLVGQLAQLLRKNYDVRNEIIVRNFSDPDLLAVESKIIRINKLITRHRRSCQRCKLRESVLGVGPRLKETPRPASPFFSLDMVS